MKENKIIAEKKELNFIFSDFWFLIPEYQRSYVWDTDNIQDLLDDLWFAYLNKSESEYFLGSLVLKKTTETKFNEFEVLDGQQRLTTFFILMSVLRDSSNNQDLKDACQDRIFQKENKYKGIPERIRIEYKIRDNVDHFIKNYILEKGGTLKKDILSLIDSKNVSISHMANAIETMKTFFKEKSEKEIEDFGVFLGLKLIFIYVSTENREDAFRMFTILNNRGIPLTSADILKSINIGEISDEKEREKYAKKWEEIEGELGNDFDRFLSFIRTIIVKEKARLNLLDEFEDNIYKKEFLKKGKETIDLVNEYKNIYDIIIKLNTSDNLSNEYKNLLTIMDIGLPSGDWIPSVLLYFKKFGDNKLFEFLKKVDYKFSSDWILQFTPTQRIDNMNSILKIIELSNTPDEVLNNSKLFTVNKESLESILRDDIYGRRFTRYILLKYEYLLGDNTVHLSNYKTISVEHILPQNPVETSEWKKIFNEEDREKLTHKLGNLILISKKKNSLLSNLDFSEKKNRYFNGRIDIFPSGKIFTKQIDWNPALINERQDTMISELVK
ncbi:hypothetical protein EB1_05550 [Empedobacter brevis NBRC 14943 = ATCC 43319]|uniref:DUF262 domain-containing protein n=1 Tax=Empedobacter brevis NBRC 14943 = ATCC 43319 TaxID=1218108 RepID=A0A511ND81_9FLAO|nr:DUF262 domain-containing protein [Empedobacter brevis]GEM50765.1 hypothetical protein EB1_05550 [Empedobacter brevis NBRC 14943 = ATCC 43319]